MNGGLAIVSGDSDQTLKGWAASLAIHLFLCAIAVTIMPKLTLVAEQEPFTWEVALVERAHDVSSPDVPDQTLKVQPPKPLQSQFTRPVEPPPDMVMPQPIRPMQEIAQVEPKPVEPQEIKEHEVEQPEPVVKEVVPAEVVEEVAQKLTPVAEPVATAHTYVASTSAAPQSDVEHRSEPAAMASAPPVVVSEPATMSPSPSPAIAAPAASHTESVAAPSVPAAHEQASVGASTSAPRPATKADYAWLAESLGRRIAALTRYPSTARLNGWEGRVVLRAVIRADGHLAHVTVQRSSGYDALDRAAMETIRLACPLHMKHALSTPEVAVNVPIVYSLSN
jgi:protein TonB